MATVEQLNKDVQDLRIQSGIHEQRLDVVESSIKKLETENKAIYEINTNVKLLAEGMMTVKQDLTDVKEDIQDVKSNHSQLGNKFETELDSVKTEINEVKNIPNNTKAAWWDKVIWLIVGGCLTALVTAVISNITK